MSISKKCFWIFTKNQLIIDILILNRCYKIDSHTLITFQYSGREIYSLEYCGLPTCHVMMKGS